jgi:hypothetical protein
MCPGLLGAGKAITAENGFREHDEPGTGGRRHGQALPNHLQVEPIVPQPAIHLHTGDLPRTHSSVSSVCYLAFLP